MSDLVAVIVFGLFAMICVACIIYGVYRMGGNR